MITACPATVGYGFDWKNGTNEDNSWKNSSVKKIQLIIPMLIRRTTKNLTDIAFLGLYCQLWYNIEIVLLKLIAKFEDGISLVNDQKVFSPQ